MCLGGGVGLEDLRCRIGIVAQQTLLLNDTVAENIAYGRPTASADEIREAARLARAAEFIEELPQGYDTLVGEQGVKLSGGQRQRLALARALLLRPRILIFDEATSMFDLQGEQDFFEGSAEFLAGRTVLIIGHRPAALAVADRVLKLEGGVVERV